MILNRIKSINVNLLINISLGLIGLNILYFFLNLQMISFINSEPIDRIILSNPFLASEILAICGKLWIASLLISIKKKPATLSNEQINAWLVLLICTQLLMLNYLLVSVLALLWYRNHGALSFPQIPFREIFTSKIIFILVLHIFILFVNLRIQFFL